LTPGTSLLDDNSNNGAATKNEELILNLNKRIERLEESIGRLIMDKESTAHPDRGVTRDNCCVTFVESENGSWGDAESQAANGRGNCCVTYRSQRSSDDKIFKRRMGFFFLTFAMIICWTTLLAFAHRRPPAEGNKD
jgi:hypothetical protein